METKNEQQKQNLIWIFISLVLIIICSLLLLENKKIEKIMVLISMNHNPYGIGINVHHRQNDDILSLEKRINEQFLEFAREIEELKHNVSIIIDNKQEIKEIDNNESEIETKKDSKDNSNKTFKSRRKSTRKNDQFAVETDYNENDKEYKVEIKLPNDFSLDDIKVTLKNSILRIKIEKEYSEEDNNNSYYKYGSFYRSFTIPKTKAITEDIEKKLEDGKLEIKVPIK